MNTYSDHASPYGGPKASNGEAAPARESDLRDAEARLRLRRLRTIEFQLQKLRTSSEQTRPDLTVRLETDSVFKRFTKGSIYYLVLLVGLSAAVVLVTGEPKNALFVAVACLFAWIVSRLSVKGRRAERSR